MHEIAHNNSEINSESILAFACLLGHFVISREGRDRKFYLIPIVTLAFNKNVFERNSEQAELEYKDRQRPRGT